MNDFQKLWVAYYKSYSPDIYNHN